MPFANEHAARQREPEDFQPGSFRRKEIAPGVNLILGRLKGETTMTVQTVRFDADKFTPAEARAWLEEHDYKTALEKATGEKAELSDGALALGSVKGVELLRPGKYKPCSGQGEVEITDKTLAELAANFAENPEVPLVIGHDEKAPSIKTDTPAAGWMERLYVAGGKLLADFRDIPATVARWINGKVYRKVSLGYQANGKTGAVACHVALLGAMPPAVDGLADFPRVAFSAGSQDGVIVLLAEVQEQGGEGDNRMADEKKVDDKPSPPAGKPDEKPPAKADEGLVALAAANREARETLALVRQETRSIRVEALKARAAALKTAQKLTPGEEANFIAFGEALLGVEGMVQLAAADGKKAEKSLFQAFIELAEARPALTVLGEAAADGEAGDEKSEKKGDPKRAAQADKHGKYYDENRVALSSRYTREQWVDMQILADGFPPVKVVAKTEDEDEDE